MANIYYWGAVDEILQSMEPTAAHPPDSNPYELNQLEDYDKKTNVTRKKRRSKSPATTEDHSSQLGN